jgi:hypothetical protein
MSPLNSEQLFNYEPIRSSEEICCSLYGPSLYMAVTATDKRKSICREVAMAYSRHLYDTIKYNHINPVPTALVKTKNQTAFLLNTSAGHYHYANLLASHPSPVSVQIVSCGPRATSCPHMLQIREVKWQPEVGQRVN